MAHSAEEISKHIRVYIAIFLALAVLTGVTVWASYLQVSPGMHVFVALAIASVKATLVAAYFMHLVSEKNIIRLLFIMSLVFFVFMILMTLASDSGVGPRVPFFYS